MKTIHVLGTGGTIASTGSAGGAKPKKRGEELVQSVFGGNPPVNLIVKEVAQVSSFHMGFETMASIVRSAKSAASDGSDGIIVTHGTDTMEESVFYTSLTSEVDVPIVFTGAQRRPDETSPDGPANLKAAIRVVTEDRLRDAGGAYIVFNNEVHDPQLVRKMHTSHLQTFQSPGAGPLATLQRGGIDYHSDPTEQTALFEPIVPDQSVRVVSSYIGASRDPIDEAIKASVDGIVLEGTGLGNATSELGKAASELVDRGIPTVVASRCPGGRTVPVYGGAGGGMSLYEYGVGFAGQLSPHKARIKLALALDQSADPESYFAYESEEETF